MRVSRGFAVLLLLLGLQGCSAPSSIPDLPAKLGSDKGLLVARFYMPGSSIWENARIDVDGRLRDASLRDGYVAMALDPGEHQLVQLHLEGQRLAYSETAPADMRQVKGGGGARYYYVPGGSYTIHYTTLSVNRRFTIQPGKVTNLGLIVYLSADDPKKERASVDQTRQYYAIPVDNSKEIDYYLQTNYASLLSSLKDSTPNLAPASYLPATKLPELRKAIASVEGHGGKLVNADGALAAYGDAGTLVVVERGQNQPTLKVLDTGTLANIVDAHGFEERMYFLTAIGKILVVDHGALSEISVPEHVQPTRMAVLDAQTLMVVDNRLRVLSSSDHGHTWLTHAGAMSERPRGDVHVAIEDGGAYIYTGLRGMPTSIFQVRAAAPAPHPIALPQKLGQPIRGASVLIARKAGLFIVAPERDFYFRPRDARSWELYSKPGKSCKPMGIDAGGIELTVECDGVAHHSSDSGKTWRKDAAI